MNNYEWLATLTPPELAEFLASLCTTRDRCFIGRDCTECMESWLMEEHRDSN